MRRCILFAATALIGGACSSSASSEHGLLLGLTSGRTLWIAWPNDTARLIAEKPHLVIPRDDGIWWAGVVGWCTWGEGGGGWVEDSIFVYLDEALFVTRSEEVRMRRAGMPCDRAEREVLAERAKAKRSTDSVASEEYAESNETLYCSRNTRRITFASPAVLSVEVRAASTEFCNPAKYSTSGWNVVTRLGSSERIMLRPLLDSATLAPLEAPFSDEEGCGYQAEDPGAQVDSAWSIRRYQGAWVASLWVDGPIVCRGGQDFEGGPVLPSSFTGTSPLPMSWSDLLQQLPNVLDAAVSPSGRFVLAHRADSIMIVRMNDGRVGEPALRLQVGYYEELSMIRWATARETREWTATLPSLQPPRIVMIQDSVAAPPP